MTSRVQTLWARWVKVALLGSILAPCTVLGTTSDDVVAALFADAPAVYDVNNDGSTTVADLIAIVIDDLQPPASPTASVVPTATWSCTPTLTATATVTETATASATATATTTPSATEPPTPSATPTSSPTPPGLLYSGTVAQLVPHGVGDQLIYRVTNADHTVQTETATIKSLTPPDGFIVENVRDSIDQMDMYNDKGDQLLFVSQTDLGRGVRTTCQPASVRLQMPVIAGQTVTTTSACEIRYLAGNFFAGRFTQIESNTPIEIVANVTVPAGTYAPALHLRFTTTLGQETDDVYIAAGVGIVRRAVVSSTGTRTYELIDGHIDGQSVRR